MWTYQSLVPKLTDLRRRVLRTDRDLEVSHDPRFACSLRAVVHPRPRKNGVLQAATNQYQHATLPGLVPVRAAPNAVPIFCWPDALAFSQTQASSIKQRAADSPVDNEDRRQCVATSSPSFPATIVFEALVTCHFFGKLVSLAIMASSSVFSTHRKLLWLVDHRISYPTSTYARQTGFGITHPRTKRLNEHLDHC